MGQIFRIFRLFLANITLMLACLVFASGFFPYKPFLPGIATYEQLDNERTVPPAPFDKVIFMVVDALRRLIKDGAALPFTSHAAAPTVTMPRVKAITTGSIPSFLDMILNFAESDKSSSLASQDTWLAQLRAKENGKLVMYGDDTWLKLFPDFFARADGTSSFFVSDFTEVDNNVTRHLPDELENRDWNGMILHYLGMDHIGHKGGPRSVNMLPKQKEMDTIVQQIYTAIETRPHLHSTLFVVCGDHGMNDNGNHGGSAPGETSPALVFMSPKLKSISPGHQGPVGESDAFAYYNVIEQSDIAATLAGLLGFPTPLNNLGVFIPQFLPMWSEEHQDLILLGNAQQIKNIVKATYPHPAYDDSTITFNTEGSLSEAETLAYTWKVVTKLLDGQGDATLTSGQLRAALSQSLLSSTASNYNDTRLHMGILIAIGATAVCVSAAWPALRLFRSIAGPFFVAVAVLYAIMMFASSFVEEEQHFWYWTTSAWLMLHFVRLYPKQLVLPLTAPLKGLGLLRVLRRWNQSGQKWQGAADIAKTARLLPAGLLWPPVLFTLQMVASEAAARSFAPAGFNSSAARVAAALLLVTTVWLKITHTYQHEKWLLPGADLLSAWLDGASSVLPAQLVFYWLLLSTVYVVIGWTMKKRRPQTASVEDGQEEVLAQMLHPLLTLLLVVQTTPSNIPVFLLFLYLIKYLRRLSLTPQALTMTTIMMAHASFFAMGNTNAISSIDLSNAYNGITSYNPAPVGILLFLGNWSGPIFWSFSGLVLVLEASRKNEKMEIVPRQTNPVTGTRTAIKTSQKETILPGSGHSPNTESTWAPAARALNIQKNANHESSASQKADGKNVKSQRGAPAPTTPMPMLKTTQPSPQLTETEGQNPMIQGQTTQKPMTAKPMTQSPTAQKQVTLEIVNERQIALDAWISHAEMLTLWSAVEICAVLAACAALKTHLFVWTVFSPKFLYVASWFVGWHICCNLVVGGTLAWLQ